MSKKPVTFILSTEEINTYGVKLSTAGAKTEQFQKNPVMLYMHDECKVIGRWVNLRVEGVNLVADAEFDLQDEEAAKIAGKVERGFLKAASVSARPLLWHVEEDVNREVIVFDEWELREASIASIPSNRGSLVKLVDANNVEIKLGEGIKLSDVFPLPLKFKKEMDLKEIAKALNLTDTASEADILEAIGKKKQAETELVELKAKQVADKKAEAIRLTDAAIADGRLSADKKEQFLRLADTDFEVFQTTIKMLEKPISLTDTLRTHQQSVQAPKGRETWSFSDWQQKDGDGLYHMAKNNFDAYSKLFKDEFGVEPIKNIA